MTDTDRRDQLIAKLPPLQKVLRGSLLKYYHEGCKCHPKGRYGPYWYLSVKMEGKTKMRKLQDHHVAQIKAAIKNYERWWKDCLRVFELNTQLILNKEG